MVLTTKAKYAIIASIDLAKMTTNNDNKISVYEIAEKQHISIAYLEQIFSKLRQAGIVNSSKGPNGGYVFTKEIQDITLLDIVKAVDENIKMTNCEECRNTCRIDDIKHKCDAHNLWSSLTAHINKFFNNISLQDAVNDNLDFK